MKNNNNKRYILSGAILAIAFGVLMATPAKAQASIFGQLIDPLGLFSQNTPTKKIITNNIVDSNNTNSNINSPGGSVSAGPVTTNPGTVTNPAPSPNYNYNYNSNVNTAPSYSSPSYAYSTPVYETPVYNYYPTYPTYPSYPSYNTYTNPLYVACYATPITSYVGNTVVWYASAVGGNGSYNYTWTGTDGLYGYGSSVQKAYYASGSKSATVTVISGGQSMSKNCNDAVNVYGSNYNNYPTYPTVPTYPSYPVQTYPIAQAYPVPYQIGPPELDVACFADPTSVRVNQPTNWTAEATGGIGPYTYSWTGSDDLNGSDRTVLKYYGMAGQKHAVVTVHSIDGMSGTKACSNAVTVLGTATVVHAKPIVAPPQAQVVPVSQNNADVSSASLFSLQNVPWGWVALIIILVLFFTVVYLMFNKTKI